MKLYFLSILVFSSFILNAQITFKKQFQTPFRVYASTVLQTFDHGYIILARHFGPGVNNPKTLLIKTNETGDTLWTRKYSNCANGDSPQGIVQCPDSGFAVLGRTTGVYLLRLNKNGDSLWAKELGSGVPRGIEISQHNEFIITGGDTNLLFIRATFNGDLLIHKNISINPSGYIPQEGWSIKPTYDNGTIVGGTSDWITGSYAFIVKTDYYGDIQWVERYSYLETSQCSSIDITNDSGFILAGNLVNPYQSAFLLKTNFVGDTLWVKKFNSSKSHSFFSVSTCIEGDYIACGYTDSFIPMKQILLTKTDQGGSLIWSRTLYSAEYLFGMDVKQTNDGGFVILGDIQENDTSSYDLILIKTDTSGNVTWIKDVYHSPSFSVYPNPASEYITIEIPEQSINATIEIFDLSGKCLIKTKSVPGNKVTTIYIGSLEPGEYLVKISNGNNVYSTKKIIRI